MNNHEKSQEEPARAKVRVYSKTELARLYFPGCSESAARMRLSRWMTACRELWNALERIGYNSKRHLLSPREVRLIFECLGEP